mgnify:CR=1
MYRLYYTTKSLFRKRNFTFCEKNHNSKGFDEKLIEPVVFRVFHTAFIV